MWDDSCSMYIKSIRLDQRIILNRFWSSNVLLYHCKMLPKEIILNQINITYFLNLVIYMICINVFKNRKWKHFLVESSAFEKIFFFFLNKGTNVYLIYVKEGLILNIFPKIWCTNSFFKLHKNITLFSRNCREIACNSNPKCLKKTIWNKNIFYWNCLFFEKNIFLFVSKGTCLLDVCRSTQCSFFKSCKNILFSHTTLRKNIELQNGSKNKRKSRNNMNF